MKIKISEWKNIEKPVLEQYEKKGLDKTMEFCALAGINLMASLHFIIKKYPNDEKACEKLKSLIQWYGANLEEEWLKKPINFYM